MNEIEKKLAEKDKEIAELKEQIRDHELLLSEIFKDMKEVVDDLEVTMKDLTMGRKLNLGEVILLQKDEQITNDERHRNYQEAL